MYKIKKISQGKEKLLYVSNDKTCIADYAFNNYMYKQQLLMSLFLHNPNDKVDLMIQNPDKSYMTQKELQEFIEQYYPDQKQINKINEREELQKTYLGKKLISCKMIAPWYMLYLANIKKQESRVKLLSRLTSYLHEDKQIDNQKEQAEI